MIGSMPRCSSFIRRTTPSHGSSLRSCVMPTFRNEIYAFTTCRHQDRAYPELTIPRVVLWEKSWLDFRPRLSDAIMTCQLNGLFDVVSGCTQDHHLTANRVSPKFGIQEAEQQS